MLIFFLLEDKNSLHKKRKNIVFEAVQQKMKSLAVFLFDMLILPVTQRRWAWDLMKSYLSNLKRNIWFYIAEKINSFFYKV